MIAQLGLGDTGTPNREREAHAGGKGLAFGCHRRCHAGAKEGRDEGESSKNFGCRVGLENLKSRRVGGQEYGSNA